MKLHFKKYQGTGNDFIIIDNRQNQYINLDVAKLCHPKFGIGADGLMLLQNTEGYDFEMVYYNSDGRISTMCGNGGRCIVDFAKRLGVFNDSKTHFKAIDGPHDAYWKSGEVELKMQNVHKIEERNGHYILNTGSPHYVIFMADIDGLDIVHEARKIRYNDVYKIEGINVNFVEIIDSTHIKVRTYERGVENETLSCGTGVTASAIAFGKRSELIGNHIIDITTPGGELQVRYQSGAVTEDVWLCGPATEVFSGVIEI